MYFVEKPIKDNDIWKVKGYNTCIFNNWTTIQFPRKHIRQYWYLSLKTRNGCAAW